MKLIHQSLESAGLLNRIQILALNVLDKTEFEGLLVAHLAENDGHTKQLRAQRRPPTPLARDQLVARADLPHNERLDDSAGADRLRQFLECCLWKPGSRLVRARIE
jgi:hypothetical protein